MLWKIISLAVFSMLLSVFSALLLVLSFPNFNLNYLVFIGFLPLFFAIEKKNLREAFFISYICGFLFYLGVLYWLYHVTVTGLIVLCLYLALYFGILGVVFNQFVFHSLFFGYIFIPLVWVLLEMAQSRFLTGFGWALLGYSQYRNLPLIQIADFSGVYGVSFAIMMLNITIYRMIKKSFYEAIVAGIILALMLSYGTLRLAQKEKGEGVKISVVQGNIPQELKWNPDESEVILNKYVRLTKVAAQNDPDLIVWPETAFPGFFFIDKDMTREVLKLTKETKIPLLFGANTEKGLKSFNSAVLLSPENNSLSKYDKIHLVPFGEYVPFSDKIPFLHNLVLGELGEFTAGKEFKVFSIQPRLSRAKSGGTSSLNPKFATLICFEDIFPVLARQFVRNGAQFLVVITNDAWYGKSGAPYQHTACSVFRAIENRVPVVRCANTGYSCFIDSKGKIYDSVQQNNANLFITGYKTSEIKIQP